MSDEQHMVFGRAALQPLHGLSIARQQSMCQADLAGVADFVSGGLGELPLATTLATLRRVV